MSYSKYRLPNRMLTPLFPRKILLSTTVPVEWRDRMNSLAKLVTETGTVIELYTRGMLSFIQKKPYLKKGYEWEASQATKKKDPLTGALVPTGYVHVNVQLGHIDLPSGERIEPEALLGQMETVVSEHLPWGTRNKPNLQRLTIAVYRHILFSMYPEDEYITTPAIRKKKSTHMLSSVPADLLEDVTASSRKLRPPGSRRTGWYIGFVAEAEEREFLEHLGGSQWLRKQLHTAMSKDQKYAQFLEGAREQAKAARKTKTTK